MAVALQRLDQGLTLCRDASGLPAAAEAAAPYLPRFCMRAASAEAAEGAWPAAHVLAQQAIQAFQQMGNVAGEASGAPRTSPPSLLKGCVALHYAAHSKI